MLLILMLSLTIVLYGAAIAVFAEGQNGEHGNSEECGDGDDASLTVSKVFEGGIPFDLNTGKPAEVRLRVQGHGFNQVLMTTNQIAEFEGLVEGETYTLSEETLIPGYVATTESQDIVLVEGSNSATITNVMPFNPIRITKTVSPEIAKVGDEVTYTFVVENLLQGTHKHDSSKKGTDLHKVRIIDEDINFDSGFRSDDEGDLHYGDPWTVTATHIMTSDDFGSAGFFKNTAVVTAIICPLEEVSYEVTASDDAVVTSSEPVPEKGSITVTKTFSDQNGAEVTVELYEITESGDVLVASQITVGHVTIFTDRDIGRIFKIVENPSISGYTATYPDGQNVVFGEDESAELRILNTLITAEPQKGSLAVSKSYSDGSAVEVAVDLYKVLEGEDVLITSQSTAALVTTFSNLDIGSTYKISEGSVPAGYSVSYPQGQTIGITGVETESLSIRNTLITSSGGSSGGGGSSRRSSSNGNSTADIAPEPVPEALPEAISVPEAVVQPVPEPAPVMIEEIVPLGVAVLPKTGELPVELFYGLGSVLTALGACLKRK